jgi:tRNA-specific 2-thiouridylase
MGIAAPRPLYVIDIDASSNNIMVGTWEEQFRHGLICNNLNFMKITSFHNKDVLVKTRSTQPPIKATLIENNDTVTARFHEPLIGVTPGQAAVFYDDDLGVLGGGIITKSLGQKDFN